MGGTGVAETVHGELDTGLLAVLGGHRGEGVFGKDVVVIAEPESVSGLGALKVGTTIFDIAVESVGRRAGDRDAAVPAVLGVAKVEEAVGQVDG